MVAVQGSTETISKLYSFVLPGLLLLVMLMSAILVSHTVHLTRTAVGELQKFEKQRNALDVEWSQLLLEQSTLGSFIEIENKAKGELKMAVPEVNQVVTVKP
jgi:cell division protein FtsL